MEFFFSFGGEGFEFVNRSETKYRDAEGTECVLSCAEMQLRNPVYQELRRIAEDVEFEDCDIFDEKI